MPTPPAAAVSTGLYVNVYCAFWRVRPKALGPNLSAPFERMGPTLTRQLFARMLPSGRFEDRRLKKNWEAIHGSNVDRRGHLHVFGVFLRFSIMPPRVPEVSPYTLLKQPFASIITFGKRGHWHYTLQIVGVASCPKTCKNHTCERLRASFTWTCSLGVLWTSSQFAFKRRSGMSFK